MQRILMFMFLMAMLVIAILLVTPSFLEKEKYRQELLAFIESSTGLKPEVSEDNIEIQLFPLPQVTVYNVSIDNDQQASSNHLVYIEQVIARISFTSFLAGNVNVDELTLVRPAVELEEFYDKNEKKSWNNWDKLVDSFNNASGSVEGRGLKKISIKNGLFSYTRELKKFTIDYFNADILFGSADSPFNIVGKFTSNENDVHFNGNIASLSEGAKVNMKLDSSGTIVDFMGEFKTGDMAKIEGDVNLASANIAHIIGLFFEKSSKIAQVKSKEEFKIAGGFSLSMDGMFFKDVVVESESVKGAASVGVMFNMNDPDKGVEWDIEADIDRVDLDKLYDEVETDENKDGSVIDYYAYSVETVSLSDFKFDVPKSLTASFDVKIDDIIYNEKISNFRFVTVIKQGAAEIENFSADLPGDSRAVVRGRVEHNGTRPLFTGEVEFGGSKFREILVWIDDYYNFVPEKKMNEFLFSSKMRITPQHIDMTDILFSFDRSLFSAEFSIRPLKTVPIINASINVDRIDLDEYLLNKQFYEEVKKFVKGSSKTRLDQSWLSRVKNKLNLTINAKDMIFNDHYIDNHVTSLIVNRNFFHLQRFFVDADAMKVDLKYKADIKDEDNPKADLEIKSIDFDTAFIIPKDIYDNEIEYKLTNEKLNFMGIGLFDGVWDVDIKNFIHKDFKMSNITFDAEMKSAVLDIKKFDGELHGGKFDLLGKVGFSKISPSLGVRISLTGVDIKPIIKNVKKDADTTGQMFFTGTFNTSGHSLYKWIYNMKIKAKLDLQRVKFQGFNLGQIVRKSRSIYSFIDMKEILKDASTSGETEFEWASGKLISEKGILKASKFKFFNDDALGDFGAFINLIDLKTNALANIKFTPERKKTVVLPVKFKGDIMNLDLEMDTKDLERYITDKGNR